MKHDVGIFRAHLVQTGTIHPLDTLQLWVLLGQMIIILKSIMENTRSTLLASGQQPHNYGTWP